MGIPPPPTTHTVDSGWNYRKDLCYVYYIIYVYMLLRKTFKRLQMLEQPYHNFKIGHIIYIYIFFCIYSLLNIHRDLPVLLYHLWTIGAHSVQGSSQCSFFVAAAGTRTPNSGNANMVYQRLNDVGHPDPL